MSPWCWVGTQKKQFKLHHLGTSARITDSSTQYPLLQTTVSNLTGGEGSKDLLIRRTLSPLPEHPCPATPSSVSSIKPSFHFEGNQTLLMSSEKKKQKTNMPVTKERKKKKAFHFSRDSLNMWFSTQVSNLILEILNLVLKDVGLNGGETSEGHLAAFCHPHCILDKELPVCGLGSMETGISPPSRYLLKNTHIYANISLKSRARSHTCKTRPRSKLQPGHKVKPALPQWIAGPVPNFMLYF